MQANEILFAEITCQEAAVVSGGDGGSDSVHFDWDSYLFYLGVGTYLGLDKNFVKQTGYTNSTSATPNP